MLATVPALSQSANYDCTGMERSTPDPVSHECQGYMPEELFLDLFTDKVLGTTGGADGLSDGSSRSILGPPKPATICRPRKEHREVHIN